MTDDYHLSIVDYRYWRINDQVPLPLQLIKQALAKIAVEGDMIGGVMMFIFARGIDMGVTHRQWVHAENHACPFVIMHVMQVDVRVELADSRYLNQQEAGEPPVTS